MVAKFIIRDEKVQGNASAFVAGLNLEAGPWEMTVKKYKRNRSLEQNALYWRWLGIIHSETGQDSDDIHEVMMRKFLEPRLVNESPNDSEHIQRVQVYSTRKLKVPEFTEYLDKVHAWAGSTLGIALPLPEEMHRHD
ncbi:MAG: hypothetical protein ACR2RE_13035 [Geminicoccaceae bacterium]